MPRLLLFAAAREAAGCRNDVIPGIRLADVLSAAEERYGPEFSRVLRYSTVLVDSEQHMRDADMDVHDATEIAVLPPVSGG